MELELGFPGEMKCVKVTGSNEYVGKCSVSSFSEMNSVTCCLGSYKETSASWCKEFKNLDLSLYNVDFFKKLESPGLSVPEYRQKFESFMCVFWKR